MGTPVPDEWPVLEDDKIYHVFVDCFWDPEGEGTCADTGVGRGEGCIPGWEISNWLAGGNECQAPFELVHFSGFSAQRLVAVHGPYPDIPSCWADA